MIYHDPNLMIHTYFYGVKWKLTSCYSETMVTMERIDFSLQFAHWQVVGKRICELANCLRWADTTNLSLKVACRKLEVPSAKHMAAVPLTCCNQIENLFGSIWANQHHTLLSAILGSAFVNVQSPAPFLVCWLEILITNTAIMSSCFLYAFGELIPPIAFLCPFLVLRPKAPTDLSNPSLVLSNPSPGHRILEHNI